MIKNKLALSGDQHQAQKKKRHLYIIYEHYGGGRCFFFICAIMNTPLFFLF